MNKRQKIDNDNFSFDEGIHLDSDTCYVKHIDNVKGFGIFAKRNLQENELVFHEIPLLQIQRIETQKIMKVCSHCMKFIGSMKLQFELLLDQCNPDSIDQDTVNNLPLLEQCSTAIPDIVKCKNCDEVYCSESCRSLAWNQYHGSLCCKLVYFTNFVTENNLDLCILASRVYGMVLQQYTASGNFDEVFTFEFFDAVLGMMQYNVTDTAVCSPVWEYAERIQEYIPNLTKEFQGEELAVVFQRLQKLAVMIKEIQKVRQDLFTTAKGAALFRFHHYFNHSCDPNARNGVSSWKEGVQEASATIRCLRPIGKDEEICITYVGGKLPFKERREMLRGLYGFMCKCEKCVGSPEYKGE